MTLRYVIERAALDVSDWYPVYVVYDRMEGRLVPAEDDVAMTFPTQRHAIQFARTVLGAAGVGLRTS